MPDFPFPPEHAEASRRDFVKRMAYLAPVILTLPARPALAQTGSVACVPDDTPRDQIPPGAEICDS